MPSLEVITRWLPSIETATSRFSSGAQQTARQSLSAGVVFRSQRRPAVAEQAGRASRPWSSAAGGPAGGAVALDDEQVGGLDHGEKVRQAEAELNKKGGSRPPGQTLLVQVVAAQAGRAGRVLMSSGM